jgi:hypothetical protein
MRTAVLVALVAIVLAPGGASAQPAMPRAGLGQKILDGKTFRQWVGELTHGDASHRAVAILAIVHPIFAEDAASAVTDLIKRLSDTDLSPRAKACMALRSIQIKDPDKRQTVIKALANRFAWHTQRGWNEPEATIRYEAAVSLRSFASEAASVIPLLINGTRDRKSWEIRHMCAGTLWRAARNTEDGSDPAAVKALIAQFLNLNATYQERLEVIVGLGSLQRSKDPTVQQSVVSTLQQATRTTNASNKPLAIWAYAGLVVQTDGLRAKDALSAIAKFLKSQTLENRIQAVQALGALGKDAKSKLPAIIIMLDDKETAAAAAACQALVRMGDKSDKVTDALLSLAGHKDPNRAACAVLALANLRANSDRVITGLEKVIDKEKAKKAEDINGDLIKLIQEASKYLKKKENKVADAPKKREKVEKINIRNPRK